MTEKSNKSKFNILEIFNRSKKYVLRKEEKPKDSVDDKENDGTVSEASGEERETWGGKLDFFLSALGYAGRNSYNIKICKKD